MELGRSEDRVDLEDYEEYKDMPPNISLNIHGGSNIVELVVCAVFASMLQVAVLVWSGFLAYSSYADRHKLTGTVFLPLSLVLCARIVDNGSWERHWSRREESQIGTMSKLLSSAKSKLQALANRTKVDQR